MKKYVAMILLLLAMAAGVSVNAAEPIDGIKTMSTTENETVTILIDENKYSTADSKWITAYIVNGNGKIVYIGEKRPGAAEKLEYVIDSEDEKTRTYTVVASVERKDGSIVNNSSEPYEFILYTYQEKQVAIKAILEDGATIEDYKDVLSIELGELYNTIDDKSEIVNIMKEDLSDESVIEQADFLEAFDRALTTAALKSKSDKVVRVLINSYTDSVGIDQNSDEYKWFTNDLNTSQKQNVYTYVSERTYENYEDFCKSFYTGVFLQKLSTLHSGKVEQFLRDGNGKYIQDSISLQLDFETFDSKIKTSSSKREYTIGLLVGKVFDDLRDLEAAFSEAVSKGVNYKPSSGGTSSGGGGGGSSGWSGGNYVIPIQPVESSTSEENILFTDIDAVPWAKEEIEAFAQKGYVNGIGNKKFAPDENVTREQFVVIAVKAFDLSGEASDIQFSDVDENSWYYKEIKTAFGLGIINGYGDTFGVGRHITREEMAAILYRIASYKGIEMTQIRNGEFFDESLMSDYAKTPVKTMYNAGYINGMSEGYFEPGSNATRAQAVKLMYALTERS